MIRDLKPYPAYKDSGVPWLGKVPEHWEVRRLRNVAEMRVSGVDKHTKDDEQPVRLCNYVDVYKNDRIRDRMTFMHATASVDEIERFRLQIGDVLITKDSEAWNDIGVPALVEESANDLICGYHLALLRPFRDRLYGDYLLRALQSTAVSYQFHIEANGVTRYGLSHAAIKSIWLPLPPLPEQSAIVRFLDHMDQRIRRSIHAKQKLIKLLEEQKQAIIHQAVTRGLDPDVPMKDSGMEWLGEVSEKWKLKRFKFLAKVTGSQVDPREAHHRMKILIAPNHIKSGTGEITHLQTAESQGADSGKYEVCKGQIMYSKIRPNLRKAAIAPMDCLCSADMYPITVRETEVKTAFFLQLLLSAPFTKYTVDCSLRVAMPKINRDALGECWMWYPSLEEQDDILRYIEQAMNPAKIAITNNQCEISLLREYRTRLIADVVTGKVDVRHIPLSDESNTETIFGEDIESLDNETCALDEVECAVEIEE
jgi:Restriction endonuclease S subunits|nr:restriction endonuclease subunit S [Methanoculleus marisnigri]